MQLAALLALACAATAAVARSVPVRRAASNVSLQNGQDALALNQQFASLTPDSPCQQDAQPACVQNSVARCTNGTFVLRRACRADLVCAALPKTSEQGVSIRCTTPAERDARIAATGATANASLPSSSTLPGSSTLLSASVLGFSTSAAAAPVPTPAGNSTGIPGGSSSNSNSTGASANATDPQSSLTLLASVIATGFESNGQAQAEAGQVASLTSPNNFINFCATLPQLPLTNGLQLANGSCNPAPMGVIAGSAHMPSAKFQFPPHGATLAANTTFAVRLAVARLATGAFASAAASFLAAPQQLDAAGDVVGHSHVVIEQLAALDQPAPTDPTKFAFFKGLNDVAQDGVLTANVTGGLAPGAYRIASINTAANHQPVLVAIAQRGALDDMVYFTVV